jgi:hypothetical protein
LALEHPSELGRETVTAVRSELGRQVRIRVTLQGLDLRDKDGNAVAASDVIAHPKSFKLQPHREGTIALQLLDAAGQIVPGVYAGELVLSGEDAEVGTVVRQPVSLVVAGAEASQSSQSAPEEEVQQEVERSTPLAGETTRTITVPATDGVVAAPAAISSEDGDVAILRPIGGVRRSFGGVPVLRYAVKDLTGAGVYTGPIPGSGTRLSITYKDRFLWPMLVLLLGAAMAVAGRRFVPGRALLAGRYTGSTAGDARRDWLRALVAVVGAVWSGMLVLYFGEPFGEPHDYVTALLWGMLVTAAIKLVLDLGDHPRPPRAANQ